MQLDPHRIFGLMGIDVGKTFPTVTDCPICRAQNKMEVRSTDHLVCRGCWFYGDLVQLYAKVHDLTITGAINKLMDVGLISLSKAQTDEYLADMDYQLSLKRVFETGYGRITNGAPPALAGILCKNGIAASLDYVRKLIPHISYIFKEDFESAGIEFSKDVKAHVKDWGLKAAIAIPAFAGVRIVGTWLILANKHLYLPLGNKPQTGNGFALVPAVSDEVCFVVDNPAEALRHTLWGMTSDGRTVGFVVPYGLTDSIDSFRSRKTVFWTINGSSRWYLRAMKSNSSYCIDHDRFKPSSSCAWPCDGSFRSFISEVNATADPAHKAVALHLIGLRPDEAMGALTGIPIDSSDIARCLSYVSGDDARVLSYLFQNNAESRSISWNNNIITETPDGWECKGKIISSAILNMTEVRAKGTDGEATVIGTVLYQRRSYPFSEKLSVLNKNPGEWIRRFLVDKASSVAYIDSAWKHKLLEIAQRFHAPIPVSKASRYGWDEGVLRFPRFTVDKRGVFQSELICEGPGLAYPQVLTPAEYEAFKKEGFCRLFLALLGNLVRTSKNVPGIGILLTNESHIIHRLASTFVSPVLHNPAIEVLDDYAMAPLPICTEWSESKLGTLFRTSGYKNVIVSVDSKTAKLASISPDWLAPTIGDSIDYTALRHIFNIMPTVIRSDKPVPSANTFYRDLADICASTLENVQHKQSMQSAGRNLDTHYIYRNGNEGERILKLIFYFVSKEEIKPVYSPHSVTIKYEHFRAATASPFVPIPSIPELTSKLIENRYLIDRTPKEWVFSIDTWNTLIGFWGTSAYSEKRVSSSL